MNVEKIILSNLLHNEAFIRKTTAFLKPEYFHKDSDKILFKLIERYIDKYNQPPTKEAIALDLEKVPIQEVLFEDCKKKLEELDKVEHQLEWLVDTTEKFCQDKALYNALMESIKIVDDEKDISKGSIPQILSDALAVSFDTNIGHDFLEDADARYDFYHLAENKVAFDIDMLNKITKGGIATKTLTIILAGTGVGKSLAMCHFAAANLMDNKNVLYITLEMSEEKIAERIDANLLNMKIDDLEKAPRDYYNKQISKVKDKTLGKLIIKEYPTSAAHANHFRHLLNELKMKKRFVPDIIYIDYINICASSRVKAGGSVNSYTYIKSIAEEIRGLAVEFDVPIVSATQVTRSGYNNSDVELTDTSECIFHEEEVTLRDGTKKMMKDVEVGDQITSNDQYKTVHMVHHAKLKQCFKIKLESGREIIVSGDHIFPTKRGRIGILKGGLEVGDYLHSKDGASNE